MSGIQEKKLLVAICLLAMLLQVTKSLPATTTTTKSSSSSSTSSTSACQISPQTIQTEEDCLDERMHPDLPPQGQSSSARSINGEDTINYWLQQAKITLRKRVESKPNIKIAKNLILFLGDGMGLTTLAAARNLLGGEEKLLSFENFPNVGLSRTYSVDKIVPDSASTSTAYLCGIKANYGTIGVNAKVERRNCEAMSNKDNHVDSIAKWALDAGKSAGLVTTTRVTHASPAGVYAHIADRNWENDDALKKICGDNTNLQDIAQQLIHGDVGKKLKVILGGGKNEFIDSELIKDGDGDGGYRKDGRNLIMEFIEESTKNKFIETRDDLEKSNPKETERLLGLFSQSHMNYHLEQLADNENTQPTLEEMTKKAIEFMQANEDQGYFIFIEGGRIDMAHHDTNARLALDETLEFSKAVEMARKMTNEDDTLIVVTADHSHSFSIAGYQPRGSDIFGLATAVAEDDKNYLALSYANGPSFEEYYNTEKHSRRKPEKIIENSIYDIFPSTVPLNSETHGGEDVAVFASGPWSHLFTGVYDQHTIPHMMAYAACLGKGLKACS